MSFMFRFCVGFLWHLKKIICLFACLFIYLAWAVYIIFSQWHPTFLLRSYLSLSMCSLGRTTVAYSAMENKRGPWAPSPWSAFWPDATGKATFPEHSQASWNTESWTGMQRQWTDWDFSMPSCPHVLFQVYFHRCCCQYPDYHFLNLVLQLSNQFHGIWYPPINFFLHWNYPNYTKTFL